MRWMYCVYSAFPSKVLFCRKTFHESRIITEMSGSMVAEKAFQLWLCFSLRLLTVYSNFSTTTFCNFWSKVFSSIIWHDLLLKNGRTIFCVKCDGSISWKWWCHMVLGNCFSEYEECRWVSSKIAARIADRTQDSSDSDIMRLLLTDNSSLSYDCMYFLE